MIQKLLAIFLLAFSLSSALASEFLPFNQTFLLEVIRKDGSRSVCSSVAINRQTILTAAHCVDGAISVNLIYGFRNDGTFPKIKIVNWKIHPAYNFNRSNYEYDLAKLRPAYLLPPSLSYPSIARPKHNKPFYRVGFGGRNDINARTIISGQRPIYIADNYIELQDAYGVGGDSGGPVFQKINGLYVLVGIHSTKEGNNRVYAPCVHGHLNF